MKKDTMKKYLLVLAAVGAFSGAALGQTSSVTLFGIIDVGPRFVKNGDARGTKALTSNGLSSNRLGFRGVEDLGGGLRASFWLESEVAPDTGTANAARFFSRRSTVSLSGPFGEIRAGRDYVPTFLVEVPFDVYGAGGGPVGSVLNLLTTVPALGVAGSIGALGSGAGTLVRADNTVSYHLPPNLGGFSGQVTVAAGEGVATNFNRYIGGRVGYSAGPFDVAAAYGRTRIPGNGDLRVADVGASYKLPIVRLTALYHRGDYEPTGQANRSQNLWAMGFNVPFGQSEIRATYQRSDIGGAPSVIGLREADDARLYAVGYIYNLSKRTSLYADAARLQNRGGSTLALTGGSTAAGDFRQGGRKSSALDLGVRHTF